MDLTLTLLTKTTIPNKYLSVIMLSLGRLIDHTDCMCGGHNITVSWTNVFLWEAAVYSVSIVSNYVMCHLITIETLYL